MSESACELFRRCVDQGRDEDWYRFINRFQQQISRRLWRTLRRHGLFLPGDQRSDLEQDFYLRMLRSGVAFRGGCDGQLWRYFDQVAASLAVDRSRYLGAAKRDHPGNETWLSAQHHAVCSLMAKQKDPEQVLVAREGRRLLMERCRRAAGGGKDPGLKVRALKLALVDGWSSREIAERSRGRLTAGQIDTLIYRLRRKLAKEGLALPRRPGQRSVAPRAGRPC